MSEEKQILNAYNTGVISKEEKDKLLNDITPLLWEEFFNPHVSSSLGRFNLIR